jgi:eukaryotic-like serine/threonine-protein kinase
MDFNTFKETKLFKIIVIVVSMIFLALFMDKIIMPWFVNLGDEIEMPDMVEMTVDEAKDTLEKSDFNVIIADSLYDANYAEGTVVEQMPVAFSTVKKGRNVYLTVSNGEKPIIMPNLFGMSPRDAELKLKSMGLRLNTTLQVYNEMYPAGAVIAQSQPKDEPVSKNSRITITVSLGEMPSHRKIPNLIGKSLSAARQQLRQLDVTINEIEYEGNNSFLPNTVLKQSLKEGSTIGEQSEIDLVVSKLETNDEE